MREAKEEVKQPPKPHTLTMDDRKRAVITGVEDVDSFSDQMIVLLTGAGAMTLVGEELHISKLSLEDGQLVIEGKISALEYDERAVRRKGSAVSRLFR